MWNWRAAVYWVAEQMATLDLADMENQALVRGSLDQLQKTGQNNVQAIRDWRAGLGSEPWHYRVHDAIKGTETDRGRDRPMRR